MRRELVTSRLWLADYEGVVEAARDFNWGRLGIHSILTTAWDISPKIPSQLPRLALPVREDDITHPAWFDIAIRFHQTFRSTLVHCHAGAYRSPSFASAILVACYQTSVEEAIKRTEVFPGKPLDSFRQWAWGRKGTPIIERRGS